jgi:WD40 repeat protein
MKAFTSLCNACITVLVLYIALNPHANYLFAQDQTSTPESPNGQEGFQQADLSTVTGNIQRPNGMLWHDGTLFASCTGDWTLYRIDPDSGETIAYIYGIKNANTIFAEGSDNQITLWIPDFQSSNLVKIQNGQMSIVGQIDTPWGIALLDDESFIVTSSRGNSLNLVGRDGTAKEIINNLRSPTGVTIDDSSIYIANSGSARRAIEWFAKEDVATSSRVFEADSEDRVLVSGVQNVTNLVMGPDNLLYMAYALGTRGVVGRVDPRQCIENGGCTNRDVEIVLYTELAAPLAGLTITEELRLFIHTAFSPDIYSIQLDMTDE